MTLKQLKALLNHPDQRVRKLAQFELVERGPNGKSILVEVSQSKEASLFSRLHALWGLGQLGRQGKGDNKALLGLLRDAEDEVRANAARVIRRPAFRRKLAMAYSGLLEDKSLRVRSLCRNCFGPSLQTR